MRLDEQGLKDRAAWTEKGYQVPEYDREKMILATKEQPCWVHFGAGNIFKAFQANVVQELLNQGVLDRGLVAVSGHEAVERLNRPRDNYSILVTLKANGTIEKTVVGSVAESLTLDAGYEADHLRLKEIFEKDSLQMASFTITEKGYALKNGDGAMKAEVLEDFAKGPKAPVSYMGKIASLLYARFLAGARPVAMVSMDNCSHNGTILKEAVTAYAKAWAEAGLAERAFLEYVQDENKVSFPWTMIDKICPRPDKTVEELLKKDDIDGLAPIISAKGTYIAPYVNAEESQYLVIADEFPNGRPALEKGGIIFTDRATVEKVERMKVCTCLNPLHTTLAVFGCLLGFEKIFQEMQDPSLRTLVERIGYQEGLPVVTDPGILDPRDFLDTVVNVRIPNPFMPDTPQRIATDTSQKIPVRFGETIKEYIKSETLDVQDLKMIPLVFAAWLRYLMGVNDAGEKMELSGDPLLETLCPYAEKIRLGQQERVEDAVAPVLRMKNIFGVDLYEAGLADIVCAYLQEMIAGPGAVRKTLDKYCG